MTTRADPAFDSDGPGTTRNGPSAPLAARAAPCPRGGPIVRKMKQATSCLRGYGATGTPDGGTFGSANCLMSPCAITVFRVGQNVPSQYSLMI
jgi:hypothetical protein